MKNLDIMEDGENLDQEANFDCFVWLFAIIRSPNLQSLAYLIG